MKKRLAGVLSFCVISALVLTSCGIFPSSPKKEAEKKIQEAVEGYFDELKDGSFASNDYLSEYTHDSPFSELTFKAVGAQEIMEQALNVLQFEILDASCDSDGQNGECEVRLTYVDLESVIGDLDEGMIAEALGEAVLDEDAPTKETKIVLDMILGEPDWIIEDSTEIADLLGGSYTDIEFAPGVDECSEAIDLLFTALSEGDMEAVDALSPDFDSSDFFAVAPENVALQEAFFESVEIEIIGEPRIDGDTLVVDVFLSFPNMTDISQDLAGDNDQMITIMTEFLSGFQQYIENDAVLVTSLSLFNEAISSHFSSSEYQVDVESEFALLIDPESGDLVFTDIPSVLLEYPVDRDALETASSIAIEPALDSYYESGAIDLETYNEWIAVFVGTDIVPNVSGDEMIAELSGGEWFHYLPDGTGVEKVTEYDADETYWLSYQVNFNTDWSGAKVYFVWLDEDENQIGLYEGTVTSGINGSYAFGDFSMNESASEKIPPGTYNVLVVASDNILITMDEVQVK